MVLYQADQFEAFQELYRRHSRRVLGYLRKRWESSAGGPGADDLLQIVFLKMHAGRDKYQSRFPFLPWLFSITQHALVDAYRQRKPHTNVVEDPGSNEDTPMEEGKLLAQIEALVSVSEFSLLKMRFEEGLSFEELSLLTGKKPSALRKQTSRLLKRLKAMISVEKLNE